MKVAVRQFADWCGGVYQGADKEVCSVIIDSRKVVPGAAFFAFKGSRVNGEDYVAEVLANGAACAVVADQYCGDRTGLIVVPNVLRALQAAAKRYRQSLDLKVVAVTGSVGKTSTKDIVAAALSKRYNVLATAGNHNNEIGLPLTIFELTTQHDVAVLEMGMNHYGELAKLASIANHDIAVITNIGTAHIEYFGSRQAIAKAKLEVATTLKEGAALVLNGKDDILAQQRSGRYAIYFTGRPTDAIYADNIAVDLSGTAFDLHFGSELRHLSLPFYGGHFVDNALLAIQVATLLNVALDEIVAGLKQLKLTKMRFQLEDIAGRIFINDAYNASVDSIVGSVATFCQLPFKRHFAILGDIFECGDYAQAVHRELGEKLNDYRLDGVVFVGADSAVAARHYRGRAQHCDKAAAGQYMNYRAGDGILVKASRGMALETLIDDYRSRYNE